MCSRWTNQICTRHPNAHHKSNSCGMGTRWLVGFCANTIGVGAFFIRCRQSRGFVCANIRHLRIRGCPVNQFSHVSESYAITSMRRDECIIHRERERKKTKGKSKLRRKEQKNRTNQHRRQHQLKQQPSPDNIGDNNNADEQQRQLSAASENKHNRGNNNMPTISTNHASRDFEIQRARARAPTQATYLIYGYYALARLRYNTMLVMCVCVRRRPGSRRIVHSIGRLCYVLRSRRRAIQIEWMDAIESM